jgi:hypothetical protein
MNPLNYATLEASKRLVDAGIVLETDMHWIKCKDGVWVLMQLGEVGNHAKGEIETWIPAPCFTEVWREVEVDGMSNYYQDGILMSSCWCDDSECFKSTNPTDALISLLIWVKGEKK